MLVVDSRHEITLVLNELAKSCAPYATATTQQGVDYGRLPCTLYIYSQVVSSKHFHNTLAVDRFTCVGGGTAHQDPSKTKFTKAFLERLMQTGIKFRLLVRLSCIHRVSMCR